MIVHVSTLTQTRELGEMIGAACLPGDVICLGGELGTGKTTLAQAIAYGAGVSENEYVTSPTFAIMHEYLGRIPVYHMDLYRLGSSDDVLELGLEEYMHRNGLTVIEWFDRAEEVIPDSRLTISLSHAGENGRRLALESAERRWLGIIDAVARRFHG